MREITHYGSSTENPILATSIILAKAKTYIHDIPTKPLSNLSDNSLAATAILADIWCAENRTDRLQNPTQYGEASTQILTAIYLRVLNSPVEFPALSELHKYSLNTKSLPDSSILRLQEYQSWLKKWNLPSSTLLLVANDLATAPVESIYMSYALAILDIELL